MTVLDHPLSFILDHFPLRGRRLNPERERENVRRLKRAPYNFLILFVYFFLYENEAYGVIKNAMVTARVAV